MVYSCVPRCYSRPSLLTNKLVSTKKTSLCSPAVHIESLLLQDISSAQKGAMFLFHFYHLSWAASIICGPFSPLSLVYAFYNSISCRPSFSLQTAGPLFDSIQASRHTPALSAYSLAVISSRLVDKDTSCP